MPMHPETPKPHTQTTGKDDLKIKAAVIVALLFAYNVSEAGDCSPGSPIYEDGFFRYCDQMRSAQHESGPPVGDMRADKERGANRPSADLSTHPDPEHVASGDAGAAD